MLDSSTIQEMIKKVNYLRSFLGRNENAELRASIENATRILMHHICFLNGIMGAIKAHTYVEIGVATGVCFAFVHVPRKIGIDPAPPQAAVKNILGNDGVEYYQMTSNDFFEQTSALFSEQKIDVAFIDGLHTYEQSFQDVEHCLKHMADNGVIVLHDCNPTDEIMGAREEEYRAYRKRNTPSAQHKGNQWCGDVWKTIVRLRATRHDLSIFTLAFDYGIAVVQKGTPESTLAFSLGDIEGMSYAFLDAHRETLLNLKSPEYGFDFLDSLIPKAGQRSD